jgi:hypothetical protein
MPNSRKRLRVSAGKFDVIEPQQETNQPTTTPEQPSEHAASVVVGLDLPASPVRVEKETISLDISENVKKIEESICSVANDVRELKVQITGMIQAMSEFIKHGRRQIADNQEDQSSHEFSCGNPILVSTDNITHGLFQAFGVLFTVMF